jgi:GntR family transcriptional regulator
MFSLHPSSGIPIYRQLVDQVRRLIAGGQLPPGAPLPSVRDLAVQYAINPMTISKAYSILEAQGLLERNRGKPMTVAGRRAQASLTQRLKQIEPQVRQLALSARQLELTPKDLAALIDRNWEHPDE